VERVFGATSKGCVTKFDNVKNLLHNVRNSLHWSEMNHQEKTVWAELLANLAVLIGYSAWLLGQLAQKDVSEIEYGWVLVSVFLLSILFSIVAQIVQEED